MANLFTVIRFTNLFCSNEIFLKKILSCFFSAIPTLEYRCDHNYSEIIFKDYLPLTVLNNVVFYDICVEKHEGGLPDHIRV